MFIVDDIYDEAKKIFGACDDTKLFRWIGDAASLIINKGDFEGLKGTLDICTAGGCGCSQGVNTCTSNARCGRRCVTLPREVNNVLAVNIGGKPTLGYGQLFNFHLNGPGDCKTTCDWSWQDQGNWHATFRDIGTPTKVISYLQTDEDNGKKLIVYGYDDKGQKLRRKVGGDWLDGYQVPTIFGLAVPDTSAPKIARITGVFKDLTAGSIRLASIDEDNNSVPLAVYEPDERIPQYRRIQLNRSCNWVRIAYMKAPGTFSSRYDHIPLHSRVGFLLAMTARKRYSEYELAEAHAFEADAARLEIEAQMKVEPATYNPLQVVDLNNPRDKADYDIR
jgi:hypothetical protein